MSVSRSSVQANTFGRPVRTWRLTYPSVFISAFLTSISIAIHRSVSVTSYNSRKFWQMSMELDIKISIQYNPVTHVSVAFLCFSASCSRFVCISSPQEYFSNSPILQFITFFSSQFFTHVCISLEFRNFFSILFLQVFPPHPPHVLVNFVVLPPRHGRSVTDF